MDANMLKHLAGKGINPASPLGQFLLTVQEVKKSIVLRKLAEERERLSSAGGQGEELRRAVKA